MNKVRRKKLEELISSLEGICADLEYLRDEEQNAFDNMPESLQSSERGAKLEDNAYQLEDAYNNLDGIVENLNELLNDN